MALHGDTGAEPVEKHGLHLVLVSLPDAAEVLEWPRPVSGWFALEVFAGTAGCTFGLLLGEVPCLRPWDTLYGDRYDVRANGQVLEQLVKAGILVAIHFGTPCQSQSWGRHPLCVHGKIKEACRC